jgi:hypothetical protein
MFVINTLEKLLSSFSSVFVRKLEGEYARLFMMTWKMLLHNVMQHNVTVT